ncbi:MAG: DUF4389 domain-containing protein [Candidatus Micrarchaeota archaeon]
MKSVKVEINAEEKASRMEILVRCVYWIPLCIVAAVLGIVLYIAMGLQFLSVLVFAKRNAMLNAWIAKYLVYNTKFCAYMMYATDERPEIMPE